MSATVAMKARPTAKSNQISTESTLSTKKKVKKKKKKGNECCFVLEIDATAETHGLASIYQLALMCSPRVDWLLSFNSFSSSHKRRIRHF